MHHTYPHQINYCPITPYVNPILEYIDIWKRMENFIEKYVGIKPRSSSDIFVEDNQYPAGIKFIPS
jgi:ubiquitin-conjugating enzyme E2 variant